MLCRERRGPLVGDAKPVACSQDQITKGALAVNNVNPRNASWHELMHHVVPRF
jgi:hypothetical protein